MRKLVLALLYILLISSCSPSKEKKAQKLITQHLKETLNDWSSYESVKFGTLDTLYSKLEDDSLNIKVDKWVQSGQKIEQLINLYGHNVIDMYPKEFREGTSALDSIEKYKNQVDSLMKNFKPQFIGWQMDHSFRANNAMGNKVICHYKYDFDPEVTIIKKSEESGEK